MADHFLFLFFSHEFASSRHFAAGPAFSIFLSYGRCERENVNGARPLSLDLACD